MTPGKRAYNKRARKKRATYLTPVMRSLIKNQLVSSAPADAWKEYDKPRRAQHKKLRRIIDTVAYRYKLRENHLDVPVALRVMAAEVLKRCPAYIQRLK